MVLITREYCISCRKCHSDECIDLVDTVAVIAKISIFFVEHNLHKCKTISYLYYKNSRVFKQDFISR